MLVAAVFPTASELVMLYAGALASGAFATAHVTAFGNRIELRRFLPLALLGTAVFCFAVAGIGWAVGSSYERIHGDLRYVDAAIVAALVLATLAFVVIRRRRRSTTLARGAGPPR